MKKELQDMYNKLSDFDKLRVNNYIFENITLPLIKQSLENVELLEKEKK